MLDVDRLESGKFDLQPASVCVAELLEQAAEAVENFAQDQKVAIVIKPGAAEQDLHIFADGDRLIQVLVNLLSNAIKFSPPGSKVTLDSLDKKDFVEITVNDEGRGIPPEFIDTVFERFKQVKTSDSKNKRGAGLGLTICKAIVEKHGGKIGVTSQEGKGSTFWFCIPKKL